MRRTILMAAAALLAACSQPSNTAQTEPPPETPPVVTACNTVTPDLSKQVQLQTEPVAAASLPPDLPGGPITPGIYDLQSGFVAGGAPAWTEARAVALEVTESATAGVVFNWAAAPDRSDSAHWTAAFHEGPPAQLAFTCGRTGGSEIAFSVQQDQLRLRIPDPSGTGTQALLFVRRAG
jgi:hypothetical protein